MFVFVAVVPIHSDFSCLIIITFYFLVVLAEWCFVFFSANFFLSFSVCAEELGRWITPFRRGTGHWLTDLSPMRLLLSSSKCNYSAVRESEDKEERGEGEEKRREEKKRKENNREAAGVGWLNDLSLRKKRKSNFFGYDRTACSLSYNVVTLPFSVLSFYSSLVSISLSLFSCSIISLLFFC